MHLWLVVAKMPILYNDSTRVWECDNVVPEIDYSKIGKRIRNARLEKGLSQAELGALIGCSNNHMSHVEVGQTKVSLPMLLKVAFVLEKDINYFLLDTPYASKSCIINSEIAGKLDRCNVDTLITVSKIIDVMLEAQQSGKDDVE